MGDVVFLNLDVANDYVGQYKTAIPHLRDGVVYSDIQVLNKEENKIHSFQLLPPAPSDKQNSTFVNIKLTVAEQVWIKVRFCTHNLYVVAYQNAAQRWFQFPGVDAGLEADILDIKESYDNLEMCAGRISMEQIPLGHGSLNHAVYTLAGNQPTIQEKARSLILIILMFSEAARFKVVHNHILTHDGSPLTYHHLELIKNWQDCSHQLLRIRDDENHQFRPLSKWLETLEMTERCVAVLLNYPEPKRPAVPEKGSSSIKTGGKDSRGKSSRGKGKRGSTSGRGKNASKPDEARKSEGRAELQQQLRVSFHGGEVISLKLQDLLLVSDDWNFGKLRLMVLHFVRIAWARPLFKDRKKFSHMADPMLQIQYPSRGFYQTRDVAAMCVQEQPNMSPLISDVITTLTSLASQKYDPDTESVQTLSRALAAPPKTTEVSYSKQAPRRLVPRKALARN